MIESRYLFKAKRVDNGEWIEGSYVYTFTPDKECPVVGIHKENHWIVEKNGNIVIVDPSTLCQCTGLRDKNGKLIWENDIIKYTDMITRTKKIACIEWSNAQASFVRAYRSQMGLQYLYIDEFIANSGEVIGNKFDDVELLEVQE